MFTNRDSVTAANEVRPLIGKIAMSLLALLIFVLPYGRYLWIGDFWNAQKIVGGGLICIVACGFITGTFNFSMTVAASVASILALKTLAVAAVALRAGDVDWRYCISWLQMILLAACVAAVIQRRASLVAFHKAVIVSNLVSCVIFEVLYVELLQLWSTFGYDETPRMGGGYGDRDPASDAGLFGYNGASGYAFQLCMLTPLLICALFECRRGKWGWRWTVASALSTVLGVCNLLLTMQRTAYIVTFLIVAALLVKSRVVTFRSVVVSLAVLACAVTLVASLGVLPGIQDRLGAIQSAILLDRSDTAVDLRARVVWQAAAMVTERPFFGYGPGSARAAGEAAFGVKNTVENGFLNTAFESGLPYAIAYTLIVLGALWLTRMRSGGIDWLRLGMWLSVIAGFCYGLTQAIETNVWWAILMGALVSQALGPERDRGATA